MKKGQVMEGRIDHIVFPNKGVAVTEHGEKVIVKNTIPGQKVSFLVNKIRKGKAEGRLLETLEQSPLEADAKCPYFGECGSVLIKDSCLSNTALAAVIISLPLDCRNTLFKIVDGITPESIKSLRIKPGPTDGN